MIQVPVMSFQISEEGLSINPKLGYSIDQNNEACNLLPLNIKFLVALHSEI
jgi:hypothetical protein